MVGHCAVLYERKRLVVQLSGTVGPKKTTGIVMSTADRTAGDSGSTTRRDTRRLGNHSHIPCGEGCFRIIEFGERLGGF